MEKVPAPLLGRPLSIVLNIHQHDGVLYLSLLTAKGREVGRERPATVVEWHAVSGWRCGPHQDYAGVLSDVTAAFGRLVAAGAWFQQALTFPDDGG